MTVYLVLEFLLDIFNIRLVTELLFYMKNCLIPFSDWWLRRKRSIIETIINQLKNISQHEQTHFHLVENNYIDCNEFETLTDLLNLSSSEFE